MVVYIHKVKSNAIRHRHLMVGLAVPSWWEIIFMFRWFRKPVAFVGNGSKWYEYPSEKPVKEFVSKQLSKRYQKFLIYGK